MSVSSFKPRLLGSSMIIAAAIALGATVPALAADTVTGTVTAGTRTASVGDATLTAAPHAHIASAAGGSMTLTADDSTGSNTTWNVSILTSDFAYTGGLGGSNIPAVNFSLTSAGTPTRVAGQTIDATGGPKIPATSPVGTLDSARTVIQANAGFGNGTYSQVLPVSLNVPADSATGTYTGTLTTTITAAP